MMGQVIALTCPRGHTFRTTEPEGEGHVATPGTAYPCHECERFYWDAQDGRGLLRVTSKQFLTTYVLVTEAMVQGQIRREEAAHYSKWLRLTAIDLLEEIMRRADRGENVT